MRIFRHLDWLSITIPRDENWRQMLPGLKWERTGKGRHGYRRKYEDYKTGVYVETESDDPLMGSHFTITGEPLNELRASLSLSDDDLISRITAYSGKVSRIDLTIDVWGCMFNPASLANDLTVGLARIRARKWRLIEGHDRGIDGDTLDTGSPISDKRFRLYDKYAEKRIKDKETWMRLELQLRRKYANAALNSCVEHGSAATITGHIADYLHWHDTEYQVCLIAESAPPVAIPRTESKRRAWLKGQVAVALAAEITIDTAFRAEFDLMVNYWLDKLSEKTDT